MMLDIGTGTCAKDWFSLGAISVARPCILWSWRETLSWLPGGGGWREGNLERDV